MADLPSNSLSSSVLSELKREQSKFTVRNKFDAVVLVLHTVFRQLGFECVGTGDVDNEQDTKIFIPNNWNFSSDTYSFRYKHPKSSSRFIVKALKMDNLLLIHIKTDQSENVHTLELNVSKFLNDRNEFQNIDQSLFKDLNGLVEFFKSQVIGKIVPSTTTPTSQYDYDDPLRVGPVRGPPRPRPDFGYDDDFGEGSYGHQPPFGVGSGDVFPTIPPIPGMGGPPGNLIGPRHFSPYEPGGRRGGRGIPPPGRGGPDLRIPPGARFDPFTPFDPKGRNPNFGPNPDIEPRRDFPPDDSYYS